jgi:hypothetical protein
MKYKSKICIAAALLLPALGVAHRSTLAQAQILYPASAFPEAAKLVDVCEEPTTPPAVAEAMHLVCTKGHIEASASIRHAIIVCFLGGFVKPDDNNHPEIWFARYLRDRYSPAVSVWVFRNREEKEAIRDTMRMLEPGKHKIAQPPAIILYGHSWGGSQVLTFARDLGRKDIPILLTIQIDSVRKFGQDGHTVPGNVAKAVNFYQTKGLTPGETHITPADPARTIILGNFQMSYDHRRISCDNYKWLSRFFNKPHHQIENDPRIWDLIAKLIDSELTLQENRGP